MVTTGRQNDWHLGLMSLPNGDPEHEAEGGPQRYGEAGRYDATAACAAYAPHGRDAP